MNEWIFFIRYHQINIKINDSNNKRDAISIMLEHTHTLYSFGKREKICKLQTTFVVVDNDDDDDDQSNSKKKNYF